MVQYTSLSVTFFHRSPFYIFFFFFFFNDTATTEIYTLSLHDALPISPLGVVQHDVVDTEPEQPGKDEQQELAPSRADIRPQDRKSTRLNSSHLVISYAVFCLKKKKTNKRS